MTEHEVRVQISRHAARPPATKLDTATQLRGCSETRCSTRQRKRRSSGGCGDKRVLSGAFLAPNASSCGTGSRNGLRLRRPHRRTAPRVITGGKQNAQVNKVFWQCSANISTLCSKRRLVSKHRNACCQRNGRCYGHCTQKADQI